MRCLLLLLLLSPTTAMATGAWIAHGETPGEDAEPQAPVAVDPDSPRAKADRAFTLAMDEGRAQGAVTAVLDALPESEAIEVVVSRAWRGGDTANSRALMALDTLVQRSEAAAADPYVLHNLAWCWKRAGATQAAQRVILEAMRAAKRWKRDLPLPAIEALIDDLKKDQKRITR